MEKSLLLRKSAVLLLGFLLPLAGCKKSESQAGGPGTKLAGKPASVESPDTLARFHWLGMKGMRADTNSSYFMTIWDLPETGKLLAQTLDKLALVPLRMKDSNWTTNAPATNATSALLRPLLDDLVAEETWFEVRRTSNQPAQYVIAARLPEPRAGAWETNLSAALEQLTGLKATPAPAGRGWSLKKHDAPNLFEFARAGEWTAIGLGQDTNSALRAVLERLQLNPAARGGLQSNLWLQARIDLARLVKLIDPSLNLLLNLPVTDLDVRGDGQNVLTRGEMSFPQPLPFEVEPWNIPTNLIHEPLVSMFAVQGIKPLLASLKLPPELGLTNLPNQYFTWAQMGAPFLVHAAFPIDSAVGTMTTLTNSLPTIIKPWVAKQTRLLQVDLATNGHGIVFTTPAVSPYMDTISIPEGEFFRAGLMPASGFTNRHAPMETIREILGQSNLVFYHREAAAPRLEGYMFITQLGRIIIRKSQLPADAGGIVWVKSAGSIIGGSLTKVIQTGKSQLSLALYCRLWT